MTVTSKCAKNNKKTDEAEEAHSVYLHQGTSRFLPDPHGGMYSGESAMHGQVPVSSHQALRVSNIDPLRMILGPSGTKQRSWGNYTTSQHNCYAL